MKKMFKKITCILLIFSALAMQSMAAPVYNPEFSDELSRVGVRVEPDDADGIDILSYTGVNTIRYAFNWHLFEPQKGTWDTDYIDDRISLLKSYDINSMIGIGVNNELYSGNSDIRFGVESRTNLEAFSNYCLKLSEYLAANYPEIKTFLIWNEPNTTSFWKNDPNPSSYYNLVKEASLALKKNIPDCTIIAGVAANPSLLFLNQLYELGIYQYADVISAQPYVTPSNADEGTLAHRLNQYNNLADQYGGWKENYISEIGWHTYAEDNTSGVSEEVQAENIVKTFALADEYDMSGVNLYELVDGTGNTVKSENHYGLVKSNAKTKKGFDALVYYQDIIGGADFAGKLVSGDGKSFAYIYHKNGKIIAIVWTQHTTTKALSELNINEFVTASDLYGTAIDSPSLSQSPIYLVLTDEAPLYSAIDASIKNYYGDIPDLCLTDEISALISTDLISMDADQVRNYFEQNYTAVSSLIDKYIKSNTPADFPAYLMSANKLHKAAVKLGTLCNYLFPDQEALGELSSDTNIDSARLQLDNPDITTSFNISFSGVALGDTVTLVVTDSNDVPVYFNQKTIGSDVAQEINFSINANTSGQYKGKISTQNSQPVINSITASNPFSESTFENNTFTVNVKNSINPELKDFAHVYPYAQAILHQAEQYNKRANILKSSVYNSATKSSAIETSDFIATNLSKLAVKVSTIEEANFDRGFSIITTPSIIKAGGTAQITAEITNKNSADFKGTIEICDNKGNVLSVINKPVSKNSTESINFNIELPAQADKGQYFYYVNLMQGETLVSSKAIYIKTQVGPYPTAEILNQNQIATTPAENKFKIGNTEYILLDTTTDNDSKFFVMEEKISATNYFDPERYDTDIDPNDSNNISYYLNNQYSVKSVVKEYINKNHLWYTEAGYGDSACPTDYTVKCGINLMSVQEWNTYAGKFGYAPSGISTNTWWLRTPGTNIDTIRYISKVSGKCLHTYTYKEQRGIRPVYYLNRNFFKEVKPDSMGSNVVHAIKQSYSPNELIAGGAYTKADLISLGIASEDDFLLTEIKLTDSEGNIIVSPEHHQELNLKVVNEKNDPFSAFFAIYDNQNKLISCSPSEVETNVTINIDLPSKAPAGAFAKLFMWKSNTMTPLDVPVIFQSSNK